MSSETGTRDVAGRDLDALIAERVMDWWQPAQAKDDEWYGLPPECRDHPHVIPAYSTSIATAWAIMEKFTPQGIAVHCCRREEWGDDKWKCVIAIDELRWVEARADTAPLTICLAALKAVKVI